MEYKNYWGFNDDQQDDLKYTNSIHRILDEQCKFLFQQTNGKIFGVFDEIKIDGSMIAVVKAMSNTIKNISSLTTLQESVAESSTKNLIDANDMYFDKRYGFEICTEKYRFRLFELRMTPLYPVEILIDEGICKNIESTLTKRVTPMEKFNQFKIPDEDTFCNVLQSILQDKKVRYIISELQKREQEVNNEDHLPEKVIICEGQTDEIVLQAIAKKLNKMVTIIVTNGKYNVPVIFDAARDKNTRSDILIVVDSDGDEEGTKKLIVEKIDVENYELVIINNRIEDWFMPEVADFSKLKLIQSIDTIIEDTDFAELSKDHESFAKTIEFLQK